MSSPEPRVHPASPADLAALVHLLRSASLPVQGVRKGTGRFVVARVGEALAGGAGLERHGADGLLRSLVVDPAFRGRGLARALCEALLDGARAQRLEAVYLLTETAEQWFPRLGFVPFARDAAPAPIRASHEFASLCPDSAVLMRLALDVSAADRPAADRGERGARARARSPDSGP